MYQVSARREELVSLLSTRRKVDNRASLSPHGAPIASELIGRLLVVPRSPEKFREDLIALRKVSCLDDFTFNIAGVEAKFAQLSLEVLSLDEPEIVENFLWVLVNMMCEPSFREDFGPGLVSLIGKRALQNMNSSNIREYAIWVLANAALSKVARQEIFDSVDLFSIWKTQPEGIDLLLDLWGHLSKGLSSLEPHIMAGYFNSLSEMVLDCIPSDSLKGPTVNKTLFRFRPQILSTLAAAFTNLAEHDQWGYMVEDLYSSKVIPVIFRHLELCGEGENELVAFCIESLSHVFSCDNFEVLTVVFRAEESAFDGVLRLVAAKSAGSNLVELGLLLLGNAARLGSQVRASLIGKNVVHAAAAACMNFPKLAPEALKLIADLCESEPTTTRAQAEMLGELLRELVNLDLPEIAEEASRIRDAVERQKMF